MAKRRLKVAWGYKGVLEEKHGNYYFGFKVEGLVFRVEVLRFRAWDS